MTPTAAPIAMFAGIRYCTNLEGPGDPRWKGAPSIERGRQVRRSVTRDSSGREYFYDGGTLVRLLTPASYKRLNEILGSH